MEIIKERKKSKIKLLNYEKKEMMIKTTGKKIIVIITVKMNHIIFKEIENRNLLREILNCFRII